MTFLIVLSFLIFCFRFIKCLTMACLVKASNLLCKMEMNELYIVVCLQFVIGFWKTALPSTKDPFVRARATISFVV